MVSFEGLRGKIPLKDLPCCANACPGASGGRLCALPADESQLASADPDFYV